MKLMDPPPAEHSLSQDYQGGKSLEKEEAMRDNMLPACKRALISSLGTAAMLQQSVDRFQQALNASGWLVIWKDKTVYALASQSASIRNVGIERNVNGKQPAFSRSNERRRRFV
jgi:hypothetical protein